MHEVDVPRAVVPNHVGSFTFTDTAVGSEDARKLIGDQKLDDATCHLKGATGDNQDLDRNILSLLTEQQFFPT